MRERDSTCGIDLVIRAEGDLRHHIIEDVALTVGPAIAAVIPPTAARYGERTVPMDEAVVQAVLDCGGRPYYEGPIPSSLYEHWMRSFCDASKFTLHLLVLRGEDRHHVVEAAFKALGFALRQAAVDSGAVFRHQGRDPHGGAVTLTRRLIVCLDVQGGRVVKGVNFVGLRDVGDPVSSITRNTLKMSSVT